MRDAAARRGGKVAEALKEGDAAPDFSLKSLDGKQTVTLSGLYAKRPVALVFGSYT